MARDYIKEIQEKYSNLHKGKERWDQLCLRIDPLLECVEKIRSIDSELVRDELSRGCIVGIVSCIEGYFRLAIKDVIDHGEPFSSNADLIVKNNKIKNLINSTLVTKGDLIAHSVSINNIASAEKLLSQLLDIDFWPSVQVNPVLDDEDTLLSEFNPNLYEDIEELFSLRHMFAHELASDIYVELDDVEYFISAGFLLIHVTEEMIDTCLHGVECPT